MDVFRQNNRTSENTERKRRGKEKRSRQEDYYLDLFWKKKTLPASSPTTMVVTRAAASHICSAREVRGYPYVVMVRASIPELSCQNLMVASLDMEMI